MSSPSVICHLAIALLVNLDTISQRRRPTDTPIPLLLFLLIITALKTVHQGLLCVKGAVCPALPAPAELPVDLVRFHAQLLNLIFNLKKVPICKLLFLVPKYGKNLGTPGAPGAAGSPGNPGRPSGGKPCNPTTPPPCKPCPQGKAGGKNFF